MKQIRTTGSYEIVIYDLDDKRVVEYVLDLSLSDTRKLAKELVEELNEEKLTKKQRKKGKTFSYTISRIVDNSIYSVWSPKQRN